MNSSYQLTFRGLKLETNARVFGELRCSTHLFGNEKALKQRMDEDGYLYMPEMLNLDEVKMARRYVVEQLQRMGLLDDLEDPMRAVVAQGVEKKGVFMPDELAKNNLALHQVLYQGRMMEFYHQLLGGGIRHFDYTWFRSVPGGGVGTYPHCDIVYMGRGTFDLYTSWTPVGDISLEMGGLMILEGSHRQGDRLRAYLKRDVDVYCTNYPDASEIESGVKSWQNWDGRLASDPIVLRNQLGGRWLTHSFKMGDVLVFGMGTVHASLDNHSRFFRLSSDSRYQLASLPVDERWIGEHPIAHGVAGKKGKIC